MLKLKEKDKKEYLKSKGLRCPHCESTQIQAGDRDFDEDGEMTQIISCLNCDSDWMDVYKLMDIREFN